MPAWYRCFSYQRQIKIGGSCDVYSSHLAAASDYWCAPPQCRPLSIYVASIPTSQNLSPMTTTGNRYPIPIIARAHVIGDFWYIGFARATHLILLIPLLSAELPLAPDAFCVNSQNPTHLHSYRVICYTSPSSTACHPSSRSRASASHRALTYRRSRQAAPLSKSPTL